MRGRWPRAHSKDPAGRHPPDRSVEGLLLVAAARAAAKEWGVITALPCSIKLLKTTVPTVDFYEQPDYERLVDAARAFDPRIELLVLLGGDAGLRRGEIIALAQADCDTKRSILRLIRFRGQLN